MVNKYTLSDPPASYSDWYVVPQFSVLEYGTDYLVQYTDGRYELNKATGDWVAELLYNSPDVHLVWTKEPNGVGEPQSRGYNGLTLWGVEIFKSGYGFRKLEGPVIYTELGWTHEDPTSGDITHYLPKEIAGFDLWPWDYTPAKYN